jgi:hypothetical protein
MPPEGLQEWMSKPEEERKQVEGDMKQQWDAWLEAHKDAVQNTIGLGKTKKVTSNGIEDVKNGLMLSSYVAAESLEEAAEIFKDHPHLQIPQAAIEIMETSQIS